MILTKSQSPNIDIDLEIDKKIQAGKFNELLLIVPTNRKIRSLKKEIISYAPGKTTSRLNLDTIGTFSTNVLFSATGGSANLLSESVSAVLLRQCFQESSLSYFSYYKKEIPHGTLARVKNVISEYKKHGITPAGLLQEANRLTGSEKIKAADIALLYEKYQDKCRQLNVYETGDIYESLNKKNDEEFYKLFRSWYPDVNLIVVMGFDEFTSHEVDIINSAADVPGVQLYISFDYYRYNPLVFSHLDKCYNLLLKKGFIQADEKSPQPDHTFDAIIRKKLFHTGDSVKNEKFTSQVVKISALNRVRETELIAREIKELLLDEKIAPDKICVAFNLISNYSPFIRNTFAAYGIPFNLTDRFALNTSQPVISIINFLEIVENDFYYKNIFRALSSGFVTVKGIDLSNLLKVSVNLKIIAGLETWRIHLRNAVAQSDTEQNNDNSRLLKKELYAKALDDIETLHSILSPFTGKLTLKQFRDNISKLIFTLELPSVLINSSEFELEEKIKAVTTFIDTINELLELFENEYGNSEKFPLKFFLNNIRTAVSSTRYNIKERPGYGVQVTTLNEIRGLKFDYLFIAGMTDGDLPTRYSPEIFFSGSYARNEYTHSVEERYLFYQALCSWNKKLYLTVPAQEEKKELTESNFMSEFSRLFTITEKDESCYSQTLYSRGELLTELGRFGTDKTVCYPSVYDFIVPEKIQKGIDIAAQRMDVQFQSPYSGYLMDSLSPQLSEKLNTYKEKQYSISQLETYAKCPYKYFVERVLGLEVPEEPSEDIEAVEMGSLLHLILYEFYSILKAKNINLAEEKPGDYALAENLIFKIASEKIEEAGFYSKLAFYEKEKILGINNDRKNSLLYKFLLYEKENYAGYLPEFFEKEFGDNDSINSVPLKAGDVSVRGKIDRIDVNPVDKTFKVVDYKLSGKKPSAGELDDAISLQLPLYMYAAKELIKKELDQEYTPAGAEIYSLKFSEEHFGKKTINFGVKKNAGEDLAEVTSAVMNNCISAINTYVAEISSGKFNLSTLPNREAVVCGFCDFKSICRIQEIN
jgi:ATP-dependent helicase/nuclease subunit B